MMATAQAETPNHLYPQGPPDMNSQQQQQAGTAGYPQQQTQPGYAQQPQMRFPGKPVPTNGGPPPGSGLNQIGGPPPGPGQYPPPQMSGPPGQHNMRGYHQGPQQNSIGGHGGPHQQPPTGPTPTLNQLLQSSGGGSGGGGPNSGSVSGGGASGGAGHPRYPPTTGYEHSNSYGGPPHPLKTEQHQQYPPGAGGWPAGPPPPQQSDRQGPPPPQVNNYGHPPPQHIVEQQQAMFRQGSPGGQPTRGGQPPPGPHQQYYNPPPGMHHGNQYPPGPPQSPHYPPPAQQPRYPASPGMRPGENQQQPPSHYPGQPQSPHYPPPPSQSPHYPQQPHPAAQRYPGPGGLRPGEGQPSGPPQHYPPQPQQTAHYPAPHRYPGPGGPRPGESQPPSNYHPSPSPGMTDPSGHPPPGRPPSNSSAGGGVDAQHPSKSTPPPPPSPSLQPPPQQMNHHPPSPSQSPRSTPNLPPPSMPNTGGSGPPSSSPSHRPANNYAPPDVGDVTGCNSNDSVGGPVGAGGVRPSPSPTGSASSRSMSPAVGNQNIPMPPRPWSSQTDGNSGPPRIPSEQHYRPKPKKADSMNKLYEMDDSPDRRMFLDKLLHFMEEMSTPIQACPQISKNPLDLYKLYYLVKERGGFLETTRNKTWKDIAGSLGIGASSSAAYTLRKHYTKHLLPFECKFDRGGIDPQPLINQVEQQTKKKGSKAAPVPSPGSSNSQDSFPGPNSNNNNASMDSFPGYSSPYGGAAQEYGNSGTPGASPQRPPPQPLPQGGTNQPPLTGEDKNVSVSNPFDDMPASNQFMHQYHQSQSLSLQLSSQSRANYYPPSSTPPPSGYQGPPGSYPSYPPHPGGDHYGRGPPPSQAPHDQYNQQPYSVPPTGYPIQAGRQMYPGYPPGAPEAPGSQPPTQTSASPQPPSAPGAGLPEEPPHQRYPMGPPPSTAAPPSGYPPSSRPVSYSPQGQQPINGYSDYYQNDQSSGSSQLARQLSAPSELSTLKSTLQKKILGSGRLPVPHADKLLNPNPTIQGYPPMPAPPGSPPQGAPSPGTAGGKHMPPPHPSHMRGINYPAQPNQSKEPVSGGTPPGAQPYPGYPQGQPAPQQQRLPQYDGQNQGPGQRQSGGYMYPPSGVRDLGAQPNRSSPSPSNTIPAPPTHSQTAKQWIPPEGWQNAGQYPQQRPYGGPQQTHGPPPGPQQPHGVQSPSTTPIPPSQSPVAPGGPQPVQSPSPQPWASAGQPPGAMPNSRGSQGPAPAGPPGGAMMGAPSPVQPPWGTHSGGTVMTPQTPGGPANVQQWPPHPGPRSNARPPFQAPGPVGKGDMYGKGGYPSPGAMMPPNGSPVPSMGSGSLPPGGKGASMMSGQLAPINQLNSMSPIASQTTAVVSAVPQPNQFSQLPMAAPPVPIKKEIVFPPDCIESVMPVISRRRKLQKGDVSPVEAWRIMMCLKSGLLAETTWALDVLNVLLYDDNTVTYFSLNYLPGLLDILLEHLRRSLVLIFGQAVGLDFADSKEEEEEKSKAADLEGKWYETNGTKNNDQVDLGTPKSKFPRMSERTLVLSSSTNYTMKSRITSKPVKFMSRDDDPFVMPGPRDWDLDEKIRNDPDSCPVNSIMDLTKHVVTNFSSDLNIVPIVRILRSSKAEEDSLTKGCSSLNRMPGLNPSVTVKVELEDEPCDPADINLDLYQCETKIPAEFIPVQIIGKPPATPSNGNGNCLEDSGSNNSNTSITTDLAKPEKKNNCIVGHNSLSNSSKTSSKTTTNSSNNNNKMKGLESILNRIRNNNEFTPSSADTEENTLSEYPQKSSVSQEEFLANSQSDNAVMNGIEESSNQSLITENSSDFCDSRTTPIQQLTPPPAVLESEDQSMKDAELSSIPTKTRDSANSLKRKRLEDFEDECYTRDEPSLSQVTETQDALARRCLSIMNILRNLTFVPGNDVELGKSQAFLGLLGKLILLHHDHPPKQKPCAKTKRKSAPSENEEDCLFAEGPMEDPVNEEEISEPNEETDAGLLAIATAAAVAAADIDSESCTSLNKESNWWWDYLHHIREHVLVILANICGQVDLSQYSEEISRPIFDGLLHWAICPAAYGQDPFPTLGQSSSLSPRRLAIEALCKLSVTQTNVDLLLTTPPHSRIERLCQLLSRGICRTEEQVVREFSLNLLSYLSGADSGIARTIALQNPCISLLIAFIEQAEANARNIVENHGFSVLRENPENMGTSLDMLRRAATTLHNLAKHPENRSLFVQHEPRLLQLVMSQILEQKVAAIVAQVLFTCSAPEGSSSGSFNYYSEAQNNEIFYTPSLSRSRHIMPQHAPLNPVAPGPGPPGPPLPPAAGNMPPSNFSGGY